MNKLLIFGTMHNNIIFIGGIHGVGKGTICKKITDQFSDLVHISASTLLKWEEISAPENSRINAVFAPIPELVKVLNSIKKGETINFDDFSSRVTPTGFYILFSSEFRNKEVSSHSSNLFLFTSKLS